MVLISTPPPAYAHNRKTSQEKKRRDEINAKIKELQLLIQNESDNEKMTQGDVLNRAVEVVSRMETESPGPSSNPNRKGFFDGFRSIESLTYSFIKSLGVNSDVCQDFVQRAKQFFDRERSSLLSTVSGKSKRRSESEILHSSMSYRSQSSSPSTSESGITIDRKEVKKNREQDRRDRQGEAFDALKNFIIENKLMTSHQVEKMQRLNTLDIIIAYIQNKKHNFVSRSDQEQSLYAHAIAEGKKTAKNIAFQFFKSDRHLVVRCADLEKFFEFSLSPKPLFGFPSMPIPIPPPSFPIFPFRPFPFFPMPMAPMATSPKSQQSPSYSLDSPPPSSDTSSSSIETPSTPNENSNSNPKASRKSKLFRPWE
ncbi:Regulator of fusion ref-1 [Caenorhabditis elegans]|uniref:Regulator of fusion ref-1 n=1 Tax=Caenorhabditis elegans TaxID=6239 RepID=REF1_CAEEL|nr:Regulator of fusion ref-1 [Caenorhabditis elegans]G5EEQ5.1 RecName: Full=Regulator of fusion ref-1 [Caenorhabditis elegans]AAK52772.1 REF-1 [Caenorhabditis elegans]CAA88744.1 Regulator of fusion ref-1 [Caenorhabditis elegans]|eukprot:NP_496204.1 REgulator of Fusion [Caenorhabditis elegans]